MSWRCINLDAVAATAWRNGGGVTRELLAWPDSADWRVRLSVADVTQDGPFSAYPGVERWFAVLSGEGVELRQPTQTHVMTTESAPLRFDGGQAPDCKLLAGPTRDFNLMVRAGTARMQRVTQRGTFEVRAGCLVALYATARAATVEGAPSLRVPPNTLAWRILDSDATLAVAGEDALWMEITP